MQNIQALEYNYRIQLFEFPCWNNVELHAIHIIIFPNMYSEIEVCIN